MKKNIFLSMLFFVFAFPLHAQVFETVCPAGTVSIQSLQTTDQTNSKLKQNFCVDSSGNINFNGGSVISGYGNTSQVFTTTGTFTIPAGITKVKVTVVGGGGGGGGGTATLTGNGGGAGGVAIKWLSGLTPGLTLAVTVGTGGVGNSGAAGNTGVASTVASGTQTIATLTANAGQGAGNNTVVANGGTATGGDFNGTGGWGSWAVPASGFGGPGGVTLFGGSGIGAFSNGNGNPGNAAGAGGGGGGGNVSNTVGGTGANGVVIMEWIS